MKAEIVAATLAHVVEICERLRERERQAFAQLGDTPERLLARELSRSIVTFAGLIDGQVAAIWGARATGVLAEEGYIWLVCNDLAEVHPYAFAKHSVAAIEMLRESFKVLYGLVLGDYECSARWLQWLGFTVNPPDNGVRSFRMG